MNNHNDSTFRVKCLITDLHPIDVMKHSSVQIIQAVLSRMGIEYKEGLPKDAYLIAMYDEFFSDRQWILQMMPEDFLLLLLEIWESKYIEMDAYRWTILEYLRYFGLIDYKKDNKNDEGSEIYIIDSVRQNFYFYLKSRESRQKMERYERWDQVISGLSYYYGIISFPDYYGLFCNTLSERISFDEFSTFLKCRSDLWELGSIMMTSMGKEYFVSRNVDQPDITLLYIGEHPHLHYKTISYEDLSYIKEGYGIDNRWPGLSELGNLLVEEMNVSYYRSTVLIQSLLKDIQNSSELEKLEGKLDLISFADGEQKRKAEEFVRMMYDSVPVFEFKGYCRKEISSINEQKEWKNRRNRFTILQGGKQ